MRQHGTVRLMATVAGTCLLLGMVGLEPTAAARSAVATTQRAASSSGTVSGTVWHDTDSDGKREPGEPPVSSVVITRAGTSTRVVSGRDGRWSLVLPAGAVTLTAITGWLPSACPGDLHCAAGRTARQRFAVENQFVRARVTVTAGATTAGIDLGLQPDHGDPTGRSTSLHSGNDHGDGPALAHDLAARHSSTDWFPGCTDPDHTRVCPVGTRLVNSGQIYNQGTAVAEGIRFVITVPPGTRIGAGPTPNPSTPGAAPTATGASGPTADGGRWVEYRLNRNLSPAAAVWFTTRFDLVGGPSSPQPYGTGHAYDRKAFVSIVAVTGGDQDSTLRRDPRLGRDAGHNVNWPRSVDDDTSDAVEWNVR
jgi:hypothetical protein